jgi:L-amino acid N-acyltransferase YncA
VHLIAVRDSHKGQGLARALYDHFIAFASAHGCTAIKAITSPENCQSVAIHRKMGMELLGAANEAGTPVVKDYAGPGQDRVVFRLEIPQRQEK